MKALATVAVAVGLMAALYGAVRRVRVESRNRRVELAVEWAEVQELSLAARTTPAAVIARLSAAGVDGLIVAEDTPASLEPSGVLHVSPAAGGSTTIAASSLGLGDRIRAGFAAHGVIVNSGAGGPATVLSNPGGASTSYSQPYATLRTVGIGLPPDATTAASAAGWDIIARANNFPGADAAGCAGALGLLRSNGARIVIFSGDEVMGYRGHERDVAEQLRPDAVTGASPSGMLYGAVEFGKQRGETALLGALHGTQVCVHSIQTAEIGQMDDREFIDRFSLAARERNIRLCYLRMPSFAGSSALDTDCSAITQVRAKIAHGTFATGGGMVVGPARPFSDPALPRLLYALMGLAVGAGVALCALRLMGDLGRAGLPATVGAAALFGLMAGTGGETGRKLAALSAGIGFPTLACLAVWPTGTVPGRRAALRTAVGKLAVASATTLAGILLVIGLLAARIYMVRTSQFLGIKAQHAVPVLAVAFAALIGGPAGIAETFAAWRARASAAMRSACAEPARYGALLAGIVALAVLLLVVARTGNDSGVGVSATELKLRLLMDRVLIARPRTKEFLVGHPALILAWGWALRGRRRMALAAFVVASLGQASLLNTFCHIHTPLVVSAWRAVIGLVLGAAIGGVLFVAGEKVMPRPAGSASQD